MSKSEYAPVAVYDLLYPNLSRANALVLRLCLETGMRVGDAVALPMEALRRAERKEKNKGICYGFSYTAQKTGKSGNVEISEELYFGLVSYADSEREWVFPSHSKSGHRTRTAVWADVSKTARRLALPVHITPHSARKTYAVELTAREGIEATQQALQHDRISTTALYYAYANRGVYHLPESPLPESDIERIAVKVATILADKLGLRT